MSTHAGSVSEMLIQTSAQSVPSTPPWFGEVTIIAHYLIRLGLLESITDRVRFGRRRFGDYDLIDFVVVLISYALSMEEEPFPSGSLLLAKTMSFSYHLVRFPVMQCASQLFLLWSTTISCLAN